jgi:hypothetical protein
MRSSALWLLPGPDDCAIVLSICRWAISLMASFVVAPNDFATAVLYRSARSILIVHLLITTRQTAKHEYPAQSSHRPELTISSSMLLFILKHPLDDLLHLLPLLLLELVPARSSILDFFTGIDERIRLAALDGRMCRSCIPATDLVFQRVTGRRKEEVTYYFEFQ